MWKQWKKKITDFLFKEVEVEEKERKKNLPKPPAPHKQDLQTRMVYQYPERKSFRFPVIPDKPAQQNTADTPVFQSKKQENNSATLKQTETYQYDRKESKPDLPQPETDKPFEPSHVPSPIYGFQRTRTKNENKEIEDVPAFERKAQQNSKEEKAEPIHDPEPVHNPEPIHHPKQVHDPEPVHNSESPNTTERNSVEKQVQTNGEMQKQKPAAKQNKAKPLNNKEHHRRQHKQQEQLKTPPFNVLMSANDKQKQLQKMEQTMPVSEPVKPEIKKTIPYHLLNDPVEKDAQDLEWVNEQKELLNKTLKHFNVRAHVVNTTQGPSVTRFEVQPEMGVKVSKVKNLSDDLKLNMAAKDIRIEAPIPGKNTIGIEIPNPQAQVVGLQEIFETELFQQNASPLTIGLGLDIEGNALVTNIQKMPHGLIAGATGSGKSVCINTILISLLYKANHEDVKFMLIDPKMVELAPFNGIPHLLSPVITDVKAATIALKWAVNEMEERYDKFAHEGVRDVERYNRKMDKQNRSTEKLPFIVIVIDELADLMMVSPQDVEDAICRIAQKARACGIHMLLATQRPSVDVITGLIKANIPTRIAFSVSSQVDSRTIMDTNGAEKLLGKGDMLLIENGAGKSMRLQGAFVSDDEIERVTDYARSIAEPNYVFEQEQLLEQMETEDHEDELLNEAIEFVVDHNSASTSLLQRRFKIGYNRAARLMDSMETRGIIAQQNGSKPREVLMSPAQIKS